MAGAEQSKRDRDAFFDRLEAIAARANVSETEDEELVAEAVRTVWRLCGAQIGFAPVGGHAARPSAVSAVEYGCAAPTGDD